MEVGHIGPHHRGYQSFYSDRFKFFLIKLLRSLLRDRPLVVRILNRMLLAVAAAKKV